MLRASSVRSVSVPLVLAGLFALALLPGCARGSFLGDRYNNFRAYYNTYYNAKRAFEVGEEQLTRPDQRVDRGRYLSVFTDQPTAAGGRPAQGGSFQDAIDKGADLLRERPDSKWADDALLLIGKAYYYQGNYIGAEGKFRETIDAADERNQQELGDEARFWLGRTLTASERFDEATSVLESGIAQDEVRRYWRSRMQLAIAELFVQQRAWDDAANALTEAIPEVRDADLAGRAQFLLGQVLEASGRYEAAVEAYARVQRFKPVYELGYAAQLNRALVLGLDAGQTGEALSFVRRMRSDDKNFQNRAEVELVYARLLAADGQVEDARARYEELLYGEEFRSNAARGPVYYHYGELFRDGVNDYTRASAYFDSAATSLRTEPGREELYTRKALVGVRRQADVYHAYADLAREMEEADSLLYLGSLDDDAFRDAIARIEAERRRAWEQEQRRLNQRRAEAGFGDALVLRGGETGGGRDPAGGEGGGETVAAAGFLNYLNPARVQDALIAFQQGWGDRPLVPNWRRREAIGGALAENEREFGATGPGDERTLSQGGPPPLNLANVPRTEAERALQRARRAQVRYEIGNVLFLALAEPDSAAYWYDRVIQDDADEPVALRALYALAEVRRAQERMADAEPLYRRVIETDPESALADAARERLGLPPRERVAVADLEAEADDAYRDAYAFWIDGDYPEAFAGLLGVAVAYPATDAAPRALLAAAQVFADWAQRDSLDLATDFPVELVPPALYEGFVEDAPVGDQEPVDEPPGESEEERDDVERDDVEPVVEEPVWEEPLEELDQEADEAIEVDLDPVSSVPAPPDLPSPREGMDEPLDTVLADTVLADTVLVTPDSLAAPALPDFGLLDLYALIEADYPGSPYAEEAGALYDVLATYLAPVDTEPERTEVAEDTTAAPQVLGDDERPGGALPPEVVDAAPPGTFGLSGSDPLNPEIGGFSWRVAALPSPLAAQALLRNFARREVRAGVFLDDAEEAPLYVVVLGQFASTDDAVAARVDLPPTGIGRDLRVVDLRGLVLLTEAELTPIGAD